jgi:multiple antibiotic resistance protein
MDLTFVILAFTSIFVVVDPIANIVTFVAITSGSSASERRRIARRAVLAGCALLVIFAIAGELILGFFQITVDYLCVAGGILLFLIALDMMHGKWSREGYTPEELEEASSREDPSVFPIAMPMLTGPGAITAVIILMKSAESIELKLIVILAILVTFGITAILFFFAEQIHRILGVTGSRVLTRLMGLFLAAVAIRFVFLGSWNIFSSFLK